jgi:hypothetical protein
LILIAGVPVTASLLITSRFQKLRESSNEWKMFEMEGRLERPVSITRVLKRDIGSHLFCIPFASLSLMADMTGDKRWRFDYFLSYRKRRLIEWIPHSGL